MTCSCSSPSPGLQLMPRYGVSAPPLPCASPLVLANTHQGKARALLPRRATLAARPDHAHFATNVTRNGPPHAMSNTMSTPPRKHNHAQSPTTPPIYTQQPSARDNQLSDPRKAARQCPLTLALPLRGSLVISGGITPCRFRYPWFFVNPLPIPEKTHAHGCGYGHGLLWKPQGSPCVTFPISKEDAYRLKCMVNPRLYKLFAV
jgi:hypothetical protein